METIRIERLGAQGDGVSAAGVYAPFTLPGEEVAGDVIDNRIDNPSILNSSGDRVAPSCSHFGVCGGCALQHGSDDLIATWKREQIIRALSAAGVSAEEVLETATSPARSRRRATFGARRTKKSVIAGFHGRRSGEIIEISTCDVVHPSLLGAMDVIREAARLGASRKGEIRATATLTANGVDLSIEGGKPLEGATLAPITALVEQYSLARLSWGGETLAIRAAPALPFGAARVTPPPGGFLQATTEGEAALLSAARRAVGDAGSIVDLFAGCGTFSLPLADTASVHAVEGDDALMRALGDGARLAHGLKQVTTETRDLFRRPLLPAELNRFAAVVIDPPRAGAAAQTAELAQSDVPRIAAISCNPATFARDARNLIDGGYRLRWVLPVDQFRWSPHIELAAAFLRA